jgi:hypothetical protein
MMKRGRKSGRDYAGFFPAACCYCGAKITYDNICWRTRDGQVVGVYAYCKACKAHMNRDNRAKRKVRAFERLTVLGVC